MLINIIKPKLIKFLRSSPKKVNPPKREDQPFDNALIKLYYNSITA